LSNTSHTKRRAGEPEPATWSVKRSLYALLCLACGALSYELVTAWAPQASAGELLSLSGSVGLFVWLARHARLTPPSDPLSRLRAPWDPPTKRLALLVSVALCAIALWNLSRSWTREVRPLDPERVLSYAPLKSGLYHISGTPKVEEPPYRWALEGAAQAEEGWVDERAPYLTPVQEFKGQLLLISDQPITEPVTLALGRLLSSHETAQGSFLSYRSYMGLPREAVIYLVELRGAQRFDLKATLLCLWSLLLLVGVWSTATRDPDNHSGLLYIPPELLEGSSEDQQALMEGEGQGPKDAVGSDERADQLT